MPIYAAFLGHQPHISTAELAAVIPGFSILHTFDKKILTFESVVPLSQETIDILGGTVALAEQLSADSAEVRDIPKVLVQEMENVRGKKVTFALRTSGISPKQLKTLYRECKEALRRIGRASRYVGTEKKPAAAILLHTQGLISGKGGLELVILADEHHFWLGRTVGVQDVDAYTHRDMDKPVRDTTVGLLPPKLAQILLNFGLWLHMQGEKEKELKKFKPICAEVFDPFCGTGVIPMEALLRGCPVVASDVSLKAVNGTTKNIEWLRKEERILKKDVSSTVWKQDATKPFETSQGKPFVLKTLPDVVVTETTLGTPFEKRPSQKEIASEKKKNEAVQEAFLRNAAATLPGVPLVCTWPVWRTKTQSVFLEKIWKVLEELPYDVVRTIELEAHDRPTLFYRRSDQSVGREIVLLKPREEEE
jgi:tRNA G10  N-methylase Trm11